MLKTKACLVASCFLLAILVAAPMAPAADQAYKVSPKVQDTFSKIIAQPAVKKGLDFIKADHDNTINEQKQINIIPAPPFKEVRIASNVLSVSVVYETHLIPRTGRYAGGWSCCRCSCLGQCHLATSLRQPHGFAARSGVAHFGMGQSR